MANPSPIVTVQDGGGAQQPTTNGAVVTAGNVVTVTLSSVASGGVWSLTVVGQDDLVTPPVITVNNVAKTATFTAPALPWSLVLQSQVGINSLGKDVNGQTQPSYTTTLGIYCLTAGNARLLATNERAEGSAAYGWITKINTLIRTPGGGGSYTAPTGTGVPHITAGAQDAAAVHGTAAGQVLAVNAGITDVAFVAVSGDGTLAASGAFYTVSITGAAGTGTAVVVGSQASFWSWNFAAAVTGQNWQSSGTTRSSMELIHGRITLGGSGTDLRAVLGPHPGLETTDASLHLVANGVTPSSTTPPIVNVGAICQTFATHVGSAAFIAPGAGGVYGDILFLNSQGTVASLEVLGKFDGVSGDLSCSFGATIAGQLRSARVDKALVNGANNDVAISKSFVRITGPTLAYSISGFTNGVDGTMLTLINTVAQTLTITNLATSAAGNQIDTLTGADIVLAATRKSSARFVYDGSSAKWLFLGQS